MSFRLKRKKTFKIVTNAKLKGQQWLLNTPYGGVFVPVGMDNLHICEGMINAKRYIIFRDVPAYSHKTMASCMCCIIKCKMWLFPDNWSGFGYIKQEWERWWNTVVNVPLSQLNGKGLQSSNSKYLRNATKFSILMKYLVCHICPCWPHLHTKFFIVVTSSVALLSQCVRLPEWERCAGDRAEQVFHQLHLILHLSLSCNQPCSDCFIHAARS